MFDFSNVKMLNYSTNYGSFYFEFGIPVLIENSNEFSFYIANI